MAVNKVIYGTTVLVDLTADTVTPSTLMQGYTAHDKSGALITGTASTAGGVTQNQDGYLVLSDQGGGSSITVEPLSVTSNGTYTAQTGKAYSPVTVSVGNSYTASDEGKVVSNGALVAQTAMASSITANGTYDTTTNNSITVNVSGGGGDTWSWMGKNPIKIATLPFEHTTFADLGVDSWTWNTTTSTLRASENYEDTLSIDVLTYDYIQVSRVLVSYSYFQNPAPNKSSLRFVLAGAYAVTRNYTNSNGSAAILSGIPDSAKTALGASKYLMQYKNGTGNIVVDDISYGVHSTSLPAPTLSATNTTTPTVTWRKPIIYIRGESTYFSSSAKSLINSTDSFYDIECEIWRVDAGTNFLSRSVDEADELLLNGLSGVNS